MVATRLPPWTAPPPRQVLAGAYPTGALAGCRGLSTALCGGLWGTEPAAQACPPGTLVQVAADLGEIAPGHRVVKLHSEVPGLQGWCDLGRDGLAGLLLHDLPELGTPGVPTLHDLPRGWEGACPVPLMQSVCTPGVGPSGLRVRPAPQGLRISILRMLYRCEQPVRAVAKRVGTVIQLLLQPVEMSPPSVARCSCPYDFELLLQLPVGSYSLSLWTRGDRYGAASEPQPVKVGTLVLDVG